MNCNCTYNELKKWLGCDVKIAHAKTCPLYEREPDPIGYRNLLAMMESMNKLIYQKNNTGAYKTERGSFTRFGKAGSPDFYVFLPGGKLICLEVKNEKGKLNDNQKRFQLLINYLGFDYHVVRGVDEVEKKIKKLCVQSR